MTRAAAIGTALAASVSLLVGCASSDRPSPRPVASSSTAAVGVTTTPTFDPESGMWLSDGWPVPDPDATFDPSAAWMSAEEASRVIATCVQAKGWSVSITGPGAFSADIPPEQKVPYETDLKQCYIDNRVGVDPAPPLTEELAEVEYAAQLRVAQCLRDIGCVVPSMPSYQVFEDALLVEGRIISVYQLALDSGTDLTTDATAWAECPDPVGTWGHNG